MSESYLGFMVGDKVKITDDEFKEWLLEYDEFDNYYEFYNEHIDEYVTADINPTVMNRIDEVFTIQKFDEDDTELDVFLETMGGTRFWLNTALIGKAEPSILEKAVDL